MADPKQIYALYLDKEEIEQLKELHIRFDLSSIMLKIKAAEAAKKTK